MTHVPSPRHRAFTGVFASWTWVRSATDSNGITCCVNRLVEIRPLRRRDAETWATNLCVSAPPRAFLPHRPEYDPHRTRMASPAA